MKSAARACLALLGLTTVASIASVDAASAKRGDLIYVEYDIGGEHPTLEGERDPCKCMKHRCTAALVLLREI